MNYLRNAALALVALLVPGGMIVLVPLLYRSWLERRGRRAVSSAKPLAESNIPLN